MHKIYTRILRWRYILPWRVFTALC